jgi:hypothetical protein
MLGNPCLSTALDFCRKLRFGIPQRFHPRSQPKCIQLIDAKRTEAALRAPQPADQPCAGAAGRIGQRSIYNLHKLSILRR